MKKYLYLLSVLFVSLSGVAQPVPNGGFENWTNFTGYSTPDMWRTTDSIASTQGGQRSVLQDTVNVHGGHSAMKLESWTYSGILTEPGAATNGNIDLSQIVPALVGGTPNTVRHDMLSGWYQFAPAGGDTCLVVVLLTKWNGTGRDTVGSGSWSTPNAASSYTQFSIHINYPLSEDPDSVLILISSASLGIGTAHAGTVLYIDDLVFSGVNSTNDLPAASFSVNAFPNPASGFLTIESTGKAQAKGSISILDLNGKLVQSVRWTDKKQSIDIGELVNGNYVYELIDEKGIRLHSGKFSVSH